MIVAIVLFLLVYIFKLEERVDQQNHLGKEMLFSEHEWQQAAKVQTGQFLTQT